jgi:hypothetical protein
VDGLASDDDEAESEEMSWVIAGAITGVILLWAAVSSAKQKAKRDLMLDELAKWLHGRSDASEGLAHGAHDGIKVRYEYATRGSGSSTEYWTYVDADLPPYPLRMYLRRHAWRDHAKIDRGEMVDVQIGSQAFDDAFLVEAAPADVVARMFDHEAMSYLLGQPQVEITIEHSDPRALRLAIRTWFTDVFEARAAIDCIVRIAKRVRGAYAEVEQETAPKEVGSPYRPQLDDQPVRAEAAQREAEIEHIDRVRHDRAMESSFGTVMLVVTIVFIVVLAVAANL